MNYMKGYNNRERRRRRRSRFSKGSDNYIGNSSYSSRSKYRSSMGQAVSGRWIVCLIAVIVLIAVGAVCLVQAEFGDDEQPKGQAVASGSGVTVTQTAQATVQRQRTVQVLRHSRQKFLKRDRQPMRRMGLQMKLPQFRHLRRRPFRHLCQRFARKQLPYRLTMVQAQ